MQLFLHPMGIAGVYLNNFRISLEVELTVLNSIHETDRLMRMPDVINMTGLPRSTIYLKIKNNEFPQQVQISSRSVAWVESEIQSWINKNLSKRKVLNGSRDNV